MEKPRPWLMRLCGARPQTVPADPGRRGAGTHRDPASPRRADKPERHVLSAADRRRRPYPRPRQRNVVARAATIGESSGPENKDFTNARLKSCCIIDVNRLGIKTGKPQFMDDKTRMLRSLAIERPPQIGASAPRRRG